MFFWYYAFKVLLSRSSSTPSHPQSSLWVLNLFFLRTPNFTQRAWHQLLSDGDAKSSTKPPDRTPHPHPTHAPHCSSQDSQSPSSWSGIHRGLDQVCYAVMKAQLRPDKRGGERGERRMAAIEEEEILREKDTSKTTITATNNEKKIWKEREAEEAQRHPRSSN